MGAECSECERDLRGGHWIGCSRYDLTRGVAIAMLKADGRVHFDPDDPDFGPTPQAMTLACAAIDHIHAVQEAQVSARAKGGTDD